MKLKSPNKRHVKVPRKRIRAEEAPRRKAFLEGVKSPGRRLDRSLKPC